MLVDRTVLITGASSGIGEACARTFGAAGARLLLCARREDRLMAVADALDADVHAFVVDVRDRAAVQRSIEALPEGWRDIDVLVNNAGLAAGFEPLWEGDPQDWDRMLDTNLRGVLDVTRAVLPAMVARGNGHVINIGSIAGHEPYRSGAVYCATKAAVGALTKALRHDLLGTGVRVSTVDPGMVETEFSVVRFGGDADRARRVYEGVVPLTGDDIAEVVVWVADRPPHVQVSEVIVLAGAQAGATTVHRSGRPG